jgi:UDP-N-acetylmuramoyl-tripeptide--D-alanyl-D-alanine ligase
MRTHIKILFTTALAELSRAIIARHKPQVVMITGSVGKTSTKDAVAAALSSVYDVRKSEKSFNSEIGVPLTIIGAKNPWSDPFAWMGVFWKGFVVAYISTSYPKMLVLEVGADKPGDLAGILKIATPNAVVVTLLPAIPVHVLYYDSPEAVRVEEFSPATVLAAGSPLIISADDSYAQQLASSLNGVELTTFGYAHNAEVRIGNVSIQKDSTGAPSGMQAEYVYDKRSYPISIAGAFGKSQLYAPAAALALATALGVSAEDAMRGLSTYVAPPGRGKVFAGIKHSIIIDDSYNASPVAVEEALASRALLAPEKRKVAVLGDMLELGTYSEHEHARMGTLAAKNVSLLVTVGEAAADISKGALAAGMSPDSVLHFATSSEAVKPIMDLVHEGDTVLIKGSQGVRLECITIALLANESDKMGLARQDSEWKHR